MNNEIDYGIETSPVEASTEHREEQVSFGERLCRYFQDKE